MEASSNGIYTIDIIQSLQMADEPLSIVVVVDEGDKDRIGRIYIDGRNIYHVEFENLEGSVALKRLLDKPVKKAYIVRMERPISYRTMNVEVDEALFLATFDGRSSGEFHTRFIYLDRVAQEMDKEEGVIAFFIVNASDKSDVLEMAYVKDSYMDARIKLGTRAMDVVRKGLALVKDCGSFVCEKNDIVYYVKKVEEKDGVMRFGVLIGLSVVPMDVMKLLMERLVHVADSDDVDW